MAGHKPGRGAGGRGKPAAARAAAPAAAAPPATAPPVPPSPGPLVLARAQAVRLVGVSDRTFARLESEGILVALKPGTGRRPSTYDAYVVVRAFMEHREMQLRGSMDSPRDRRDLSQAELNELRLARERKQLLPRDQVVAEGQAFVKATMAKLRALPSRLVRAGAIAPAAAGTVTEFIREAQEEIARWSNQLDLLNAIDEEGAA